MKNGKEYIVISPFRDLQDKTKESPNGKVYAKGDSYSNLQTSQERLDQLLTKKNKAGYPLIEEKPQKEEVKKDAKRKSNKSKK